MGGPFFEISFEIMSLMVGTSLAKGMRHSIGQPPDQTVRAVNRRVGHLSTRQSAGAKGRGARFPAGSVVPFGKPDEQALDRMRNLFPLFDTIDRADLSVEELLRAVVELLPVAIGNPDRLSARIIIGSIAVQTRVFTAAVRKRAIPIVVGTEPVGVVEVHRREGGVAANDSEDHDEIVENVAGRLGQALARRRADRERDESRERYRRLTELLPDAIVVYRAGRIIDANPAAADLLAAMSADDLIGRPFLDFVHPDFRDGMAVRLGRAGGPGPERSVEIKMVRLDDAVVDVDVVHGSAIIGGEVVLQVVIRDVTREKREEALSQLGQLTPREYQVMRLVAAGETSKAIALRLGLSPKTVEVHRSNVMRKMAVKSLAELIRKKEMIGVP